MTDTSFTPNHPRFALESRPSELGEEQGDGHKRLGGATDGEGLEEIDGGGGGADRKQAVLNVAFRYLDTYRELLQEEGERSNSFPKVAL